MKKLVWAAALVFATPALAQIQIHVDLPRIVFPAPPPMVVIEPGIQVVDNYDEEVFFVDNYYWHHRGPNWYRTSAYNGAWVQVEPRFVPPRIAWYEPGRFRRWHGNEVQRRQWREWHEARERQERREDRREDRHEYREDKRERREDRHEHREDKRERREDRREDRRDDRRGATPPSGSWNDANQNQPPRPPPSAVNPVVPGRPTHSATPGGAPPPPPSGVRR